MITGEKYMLDTGWLNGTLASGWTGTVKARQIGDIVNIHIEVVNSGFTSSTYVEFGTLPDGISLPSDYVYGTYTNASASPITANVRIVPNTNSLVVRRVGATSLAIALHLTYMA